MGISKKMSGLVSCCVVVILLLGIISTSVISLTGWEKGWARLHKENLKKETSPYTGLMEYLLTRYPDKEGISPDYVSAIELQLPPAETTIFKIELKLGLMRMQNCLWITQSDPVAQHIQILAKLLLPKRFHSNLEQIFGEQRMILLEEYDGDRTGAKVAGAITAASLMISALLAIVLLFGCIVSCWGSVLKPALKIAEWSLLIGISVLCIACTEFTVLAIGTHRDTKEIPFLMKGYIPVPDYGWYFAVMSSIIWMSLWEAIRRYHSFWELVSNEVSKSNLTVVGWGVPVEMSKSADEEDYKQYP